MSMKSINSLSPNQLTNHELGFNVALGLVKGYESISKFGRNPLITTASEPECICEQGGMYTFTVDAGAPYYASSSGSSDVQEYKFHVLTADTLGNWNAEVFTQFMQGRTKMLLTPPSGNPIVRINRFTSWGVRNDTNAGDVYVYEDDTVTLGVPQTQTKIRAKMAATFGQTTQVIYSVPTGFVGFLIKQEAGIAFEGNAGAGTQYATFHFAHAPFGVAFLLDKVVSCISNGASSYEQVKPIPLALPAKSDYVVTCTEVSDTMGVWGSADIILVDEALIPDDLLNSLFQIRKVTA